MKGVRHNGAMFNKSNSSFILKNQLLEYKLCAP